MTTLCSSIYSFDMFYLYEGQSFGPIWMRLWGGMALLWKEAPLNCQHLDNLSPCWFQTQVPVYPTSTLPMESLHSPVGWAGMLEWWGCTY